MFLKRVKVNDFRVLKDVDLAFEPEFTPNIYPLGSLNGGGKSTLLQLIFTLLHCSFDESRHQYLINLLSSSVQNKPDYFSLAEFEILHDNQEISLEFIVVDSNYKDLYFEFLNEGRFNEIKNVEKIYGIVEEMREILRKSPKILPAQSLNLIKAKLNEIKKLKGAINFQLQKKINSTLFSQYSIDTYREIIRIILSNLESEYDEDILLDLPTIIEDTEQTKQKLSLQNLLYIAHINEDKVLLCRTLSEAKLVKEITNKVCLAAPSTQIFLFLSEDEKKSLFLGKEQIDNYYLSIIESKNNLTGLFTYDFASVDIIVSAFKKAINKDSKIFIETREYGNNAQKLVNNLDNFLLGKSITVDTDLTQVIFKLKETGEELFPEDLSHGELKKLGIYIWLKYYDIKDSLILMDEIEIGLHPDWQYEIINELQEWSNNNQFILATHSYELCQALTPSHVKELEPKLIKEK